VTLVGDADRDRALALLRRHYAEGRLDRYDLIRRVDVAATARSTRDVAVALRGLPNGLLEAFVAPRVRDGFPALRKAKRLAVAAIVSALWLFATMVLLIAFAVAALVGSASTPLAVFFALCWLGITFGSWRTWRRAAGRT
jgi:citrate lyase beta subunit